MLYTQAHKCMLNIDSAFNALQGVFENIKLLYISDKKGVKQEENRVNPSEDFRRSCSPFQSK